MKELRFRIIELPTHQVLLTKDFETESEESEEVVLGVSFFLDGIKINLSFSFNSEEIRDKKFNEFTELNAQNIVNDILSKME